jgi:4-amino-4-deoxy-L-arabinose transferase-like glycosyltransferase
MNSMEKLTERLKKYAVENSPLLWIALVNLLFHIFLNISGGYGIFGDEYYYIACSKHLNWGYVDQPPLSITLLWLNRAIFGDSLFSLRLLPAVAGTVTVILTGSI